MTNTIKEELRNSIRVKELIRLSYQKTRDVSSITKFVNDILTEDGNSLFVTENGVQNFINQIQQDALTDETETNKLVDGMLQSIGQNLTENEEAKEKHQKTFFEKN